MLPAVLLSTTVGNAGVTLVVTTGDGSVTGI